MEKKLYVGGLSWGTDKQSLEELFSQAGSVVSATVITDRNTGRSRGFGFVEMANDEEAKKAITMFDGKDLDGRTITVNESRPQEPRGDRGGFNRGGGGGGGRPGGGGGGGGGGGKGGPRRSNW